MRFEGGFIGEIWVLDNTFVVVVANSIYAEQWNQPAGGFKTVFIGDRIEMLTHCRVVDLTIQTKSKAWPMNLVHLEFPNLNQIYLFRL